MENLVLLSFLTASFLVESIISLKNEICFLTTYLSFPFMVGSGFGTQTINLFCFFSPKKDNVLRNSTPCISLRRKKYVISGGSIVSEQEGSKGGAAQK